MIWENVTTVIQIFVGYAFLCLLVPAICLHSAVAGKPLGFQLIFYQVIANMYLIFCGFALSYLKLFYAPILWLLLVVIPLSVKTFYEWSKVLAWIERCRDTLRDIYDGVYGRKSVLRNLRKQGAEHMSRWCSRYLSGNYLELLCLMAFFAFILVFYGQYKFTHTAYAHTDEETHLFWIQSLIHNNIFPVGMYPYGMHLLVGTLAVMFRLSVVRASVNFGIFSTSLIFAFLYLLLRKVFPSKVAAMAGMGFFLLTDIFQNTTYFRFQMTFPMEFALVALFGMLYGLISYVEENDSASLYENIIRGENKNWASWWMFVMSLAWTFSVHFYVTIFAAFLCVAFGLVFFVRMVKKKVLHKVIAGGLLGIFLALLPFGVGYLAGYPLERSISWAFDVMASPQGSQEEESGASDEPDEAEVESPVQEEQPALLQADHLPGKTREVISYVANTIADRTTRNVRNAYVLLCLEAFFLLYGLVGCFFQKERSRFLTFVFLALSWIISCFLYMCYFIGFPVFIEMKRASIFFALMTAPLFAAPVQLLCDLLQLLPVQKKYTYRVLWFLTMSCLSCLFLTGHIKSGRYFQIAISEADMRICLDLVENHKKQTWTVVSTTNDLSVVRYDGYHYEIVDLIEKLDKGKKEVYIPTKDIFVVVEEQVTQYNYADMRKIDDSDKLEYTATVNEACGLRDFEDMHIDQLASRDRAYYAYRTEMMSKLHYWMQRICEVFPNEVSIYYQDDQCTVYRITQDERFLLNLAVDYRQELERDVSGK